MNDLIEKLRSVQWGMVLDGDRAEDDPAAKCVFVDMRPDDFEALLTEAAAAIEAAREDAERLAFLAREPVIEEINGVKKSIYDYAAMIAEENGRDEPNYEDYTNGMRRLIDAAIERERRRE